MRTWLYLAFAVSMTAADWPQLRGPKGAGICEDCAKFPHDFGPDKHVLWRTQLPEGKSSPVISGGKLFLTGADGEDLVTLCLDAATGKLLWRAAIRAPRREPQNALNHRAAPTPATDGRSVFVFFADFGLLAYDFSGRELWRLPLGPFNSQHGVVASPVVAEGRVILVCDTDTGAFIIGVDTENGKVAWRRNREVINGYSTPVIYSPAGEPAQVITAGSYRMTAYRVADGEELWWVRGLTCQPKSAPVVAGGVVYFSGWTPGNDAGEQVDLPPFDEVRAAADTNRDGRLAQEELPKPWQPTGTWRAVDLDRDGYLNEREWNFFRTRRASRNGLLAVRLGGRGDLTATHMLWRYEKSLPDVPAPLVYKGVIYLLRSGGILTTLDAATGKVLRQARLAGALDDYYASPVAAGGRVYLAGEQGKLVAIRAAGEWELLSVTDFAAPLFATPAVLDNRMYIRTRDSIIAIGNPH
jgi:outer membrane protein assembly factor BamB